MAETVKCSELAIGDVIRLYGCDEGYRDATVYQVKDGQVHVVRPYVHTADFTYTGGVITYLGQEDFSFPADDRACERVASRDPEKYRTIIKGIVNGIRADLENKRIGPALEKLRQL